MRKIRNKQISFKKKNENNLLSNNWNFGLELSKYNGSQMHSNKKLAHFKHFSTSVNNSIILT